MPQPLQPYRRRLIRLPNPAAGADLVITPNGVGLWVVRYLRFVYTTSAVVGSRYVTIAADDGSDVYWRSGFYTSQRQSSTRQFCASSGLESSASFSEDFGRQISSTFAAAAAGSVSLSVGDYTSGFTVATQAIGAAVNVDLALTNVAGGTMTYRVTMPTLGTVIDIPLHSPVQAATGLVAPTLSFPATVGGPAYSLALYGLASQMTSIESHIPLNDGLVLPQGWRLSTETTGIDVGDQISSVTMVVEEYPSGPAYYSDVMSTVYSEEIR